MTTTQTFARLEKAIASIEERNGYCLVASESESEKHVVTFDENLYSTHCTCKAREDCYHRVAVDRYFDDRRIARVRAARAARQEARETAASYARMFYCGI